MNFQPHMKKDIPQYRVTEMAIAIVPREQQMTDELLWDTYLLNMRPEPIKSVLVSSKGYGQVEGEKMKTTTLRHFFEEIGPERAVKIEPIQTKLFGLTNEYWVSFVHNDYMFDKKYVFVQGSITEDHFTQIPFIQRSGVMIR